MERRQFVRSIALDIVLTLITFGLYNIYIQHKQMQALNRMLGQEKYTFLPWFLLSLVTLGIYHVYHEFRMSQDLSKLVKDTSSAETVIAITMLVLGFFPVTDAIQQSQINRYFGSDAL